jgi:hypothetical protein
MQTDDKLNYFKKGVEGLCVMVNNKMLFLFCCCCVWCVEHLKSGLIDRRKSDSAVSEVH